MGIDISKITDAKLKAEYEKADKNNDGILSKKEAKDASIFERKEFKADVKITKNQDDANYINLVRVINDGAKKENLVETLKEDAATKGYSIALQDKANELSRDELAIIINGNLKKELKELLESQNKELEGLESNPEATQEIVNRIKGYHISDIYSLVMKHGISKDSIDKVFKQENISQKELEEKLTSIGHSENNLDRFINPKNNSEKELEEKLKIIGVSEEELKEIKEKATSVEYIKTVEKVMANDEDVKGEAERKIKRALNDLAKIEERQAKYTAVSKKFNELGGEEAKIEEETLKETKKALKEADKFDRNAYREFKNTKIAADGVNTAYDAIYAQTEETKARKVRREAIKDMKEAGTYGKSEREAIKGQTFGQFIEGERSNGFVQAKNQAAANRVEDKKLQTRAEVVAKLGNKAALLNQAVTAGLIKEVNGKYDLTELSNLIERFVSPGDHELDKQPKYYEQVSERLLLTKQLTNAGLKVTEHDAVKLAKLCGFDVDNGLNITKGIIGAIKGFAGGAAAGALAEALNPDKIVFVEGDTIIHDLTVNVKGDFANIDMGNLPDGWEVEKVPGVGITIKIHQLIKTSDLLYTFGKDILQTGVTTGLAGAAIGLLGGMTSKEGEEPVVTTSVSFDTLKEYENNLKNHPYQFALSAIALNFTNKDGTLRKDDMEDFLEAYAGEGSLLGKDELLGALKALKDMPPVKEVQSVEKKEDEANYALKQTEAKEAKYKDVEIKTPTIDATHSSWTKLADHYACLDTLLDRIPNASDYPNCVKRKYALAERMMKVAQAINDGNYSVERMLDLAEKTFAAKTSKYEELKDYNGIDYETLVKVMNAQALSNATKVPDEIAGCKKATMTQESIKADKAKKLGTRGPATSAIDMGRELESAAEDAKYYAKFYINGQLVEEKEFENADARQKAIDKFKEDHKNAQVIDWKTEENK